MLITPQNGNVLSGLALTHSDAEFTSANDSLVTALVITLICVGIGQLCAPCRLPMHTAQSLPLQSCASQADPPASDFLGLFSGVSLKLNSMHAFQVSARSHPLVSILRRVFRFSLVCRFCRTLSRSC